MTPKRRLNTLLALLITIPLGIAWRGLPLHLTPFWFKYGGSALWAIALYWLIAAIIPRRSSFAIASIAAIAAALIELSRLSHIPAVDAFRLTLAGRLLLGRYFSLKNIAAYWLAIAAIALIDHIQCRTSTTRRPSPWRALAFLIVLGTGTLFLTRHLLRAKPLALPAAPMQHEPLTILWAWETPEDLIALDPSRAGVAFLARSIYLSPTPIVRPRRQPLTLAPNTWLMAVVRIETSSQTPPNTPALRSQLVAAILPATQLANVRALQLDFDAPASQFPLYADLLRDLRSQLPPTMPLSITALVSWCGPQSWLPTLPKNTIDEAVPMFFRMGGTPTLRATLPKHADTITQPLCATSAGVATDETWPHIHSHERVYIFRNGPWTMADIQRLNTLGPAALQPTPLAPEHTP